MQINTSIIKLLLTMINEKRNKNKVSETKVEYTTDNVEELLSQAENK